MPAVVRPRGGTVAEIVSHTQSIRQFHALVQRSAHNHAAGELNNRFLNSCD